MSRVAPLTNGLQNISIYQAYAAGEVMKQIPEGSISQRIEMNNVSGWLMHEDPELGGVCISCVVYRWIVFGKYGHIATLFVSTTGAASAVVASSQTSVCSTGTIVAETVCGTAENLIGGEQVTAM